MVFFTRRGHPPVLGKLASDYSVGDTVKLIESGSQVDYIVVHQGKPSGIYDESCNGTWLLMKDCCAPRTPASPAAPGTSTPMAIAATTAASTRVASAPLW